MKKIAGSLVYGIIGLVFMNAVLSLLVNPYIGSVLGAQSQGKILYFTSIAYLLAGAFGSGANYARMKVFADERKTVNGEYNLFLLTGGVLIALIAVGAILIKGDSAGVSWAEIIAVFVLTSFRYYADVEYRLNLNYKRFMLFYIATGVGYLLGFAVFCLTKRWSFIYITGELFGLLFVGIFGTIFKPPFFRFTEKLGSHIRIMWSLTGAYFLSDFVGQADRMMLPLLLSNGDELTSIYYYASLVGKIMSLLSTPLNGVISGYIAKSEKGLSRKNFLKITGAMLGVFAVVTAAAVLGSHIFVYLFYHRYYTESRPLFIIANAGQVVFFICNTMMVIVLRYTSEKYQIIISGAYVVLFFAVSIPMSLKFGLWGMAWSILIVNTVKFILFTVIGLIGLSKNEKENNGKI